MTALPFSSNRRRRRSKQTLTALSHQLEHIFEQQDLHNFTLGDERGLVIAQAGNNHESEVFAAYAPVLCRSRNGRYRSQVLSRINSIVPTITADSIHVRQFTVDGEPLFLTLVGRPGVYRDVGLYRAITGVRRILDEQPAA